jgi:hypothetical protein
MIFFNGSPGKELLHLFLPDDLCLNHRDEFLKDGQHIFSKSSGHTNVHDIVAYLEMAFIDPRLCKTV